MTTATPARPLHLQMRQQHREHFHGVVDLARGDFPEPFHDREAVARGKTRAKHAQQLIAEPYLINLTMDAPLADASELSTIAVWLRGGRAP